MIEAVIIKSEDDAWTTLRRALANEISDTATIEFKGWPVFNLTIKGEDFNGTIPTRIMPPILNLQREIHRIYCRAKYNSEDTRKLRDEERETLELIVRIKPGSTEFITELGNVLNEIIKSSHMTGTEAAATLIAISAIIATNIGWKHWLSSKEREHGLDSTIRMSEQETKRLALVTQAQTRYPELEQNSESLSEIKSNLSKQLKPTDQISVDGQPVINGVRAAEIVPTPRQSSEEIRLDGAFHLTEVKFPESFGGQYRFAVRSVDGTMSFSVDASPKVLTAEQITILKDGGFGVKTVFMQINAKELRGNISSANLVAIKWPDPAT